MAPDGCVATGPDSTAGAVVAGPAAPAQATEIVNIRINVNPKIREVLVLSALMYRIYSPLYKSIETITVTHTAFRTKANWFRQPHRRCGYPRIIMANLHFRVIVWKAVAHMDRG
jgi:hypothetical protein